MVFLLALAVASASVLPSPKVLEGPSSKTTIIGPDGSKISAFAPGGKILLEENAGPVLQGAPEVVAVAGVAQPLPVVPNQIAEEAVVAPVAKVDSEGESVAIEAISSPATVSVNSVENVETLDLARSATTENSTQIEATTLAASTSTEEISPEPDTESSDTLEVTTDSPTSSENPASVVPLVKEVAPVTVEAEHSQPLVGYINGAPFYVPQVKVLGGDYVPENLYEEEILGW